MEAHVSVVRENWERRRTDLLSPPTTEDKLRETAGALAAIRSRCYDRIGPAPSYRPDTEHSSRDSPQPKPEAEGRARVSTLNYFRSF